MSPLSSCRPGDKVVIREICGGAGIRSKMEAMGFLPGEQMMVVSASGGPILVILHGSRVGIGRGMAGKILVSPESGS